MRATATRIGFIGLGVMGGPMCRHIAAKASERGIERVTAFDVKAGATDAAVAAGAQTAETLADVVTASDLIEVCLPGGAELEALCTGPDGLLANVKPGLTVIDHGTSPVPLTRELAAAFAKKDVAYADAPITRTRQAAEDGTLVTLFGGDKATLEFARPAMTAFSAEIVHCGDLGAGQVFKQLNNMVLFQTVTALAEALATARHAGVDPAKLFDAFTRGSADSFALRNHGMKALLTGEFPERAFATTYALKDLGYAIELANSQGLTLHQAEATQSLFQAAIDAGYGADYFPTVLKAVDPQAS